MSIPIAPQVKFNEEIFKQQMDECEFFDATLDRDKEQEQVPIFLYDISVENKGRIIGGQTIGVDDLDKWKRIMLNQFYVKVQNTNTGFPYMSSLLPNYVDNLPEGVPHLDFVVANTARQMKRFLIKSIKNMKDEFKKDTPIPSSVETVETVETESSTSTLSIEI